MGERSCEGEGATVSAAGGAVLASSGGVDTRQIILTANLACTYAAWDKLPMGWLDPGEGEGYTP